ncbi:adenylate/guanylate cyclase domain-containing protein [Amorphus suaedae]
MSGSAPDGADTTVPVPRPKPVPGAGRHAGAAAGSRRNRLWPKVSLAAFLAGTSGLLVGIAILSVLLLTVTANFQNTFTLLNDKAVLVMETLVERITDRVATVQPTVKALTRAYQEGKIDLATSPTREAFLSGILSGAPVIRAILFYDRDFVASGLYRADDGTFVPTPVQTSISPEIRNALSGIRPGDPPIWGPPVNVGSGTFMNVAAPLMRKGRLDGYIVAAVGIDGFTSVVEEVGRENDGAVALFYGEDTVFAHTTLAGKLVPLDFTSTDPTVPLAQLEDPVLRHFPERTELEGFARARQAGVSVSGITANDEQYVVITKSIPRHGPKPWIAVLYQPEYQVSDELRRLRGSFVLGLGLLVLAVITAIFTGRSIARAVGRIAPEAERIARFEFEQVGRLPESRIFEVDTEARAFNSMVQGLRTFSLYVPRQLVHRLLQRGFEEATRSRSQQATVLFTDIVGFTALSERMTAEEAARVLNAHFAGLVACVEEEFGIIDKFMGDGMMAFWAELDVPDHADRAIRAALSIKRHAEACAAQSRLNGDPPLRIRIGVHSGSVIVGNLGSPDRVNYTIVGDTVNVAARLESFGRNIDASADAIILASEATVDRLSFPVVREPVGAVHLTGREALVDIWRIVDREMPAALTGPQEPNAG